jgi:type IX secretion system PorP/SprF family membrane protein
LSPPLFPPQGGAIKQNGVMLNYSYNLKLNKESGLSFGVAGIINQYSYDGTGIENINPDATLQSNVKQVAPDMNFGLVYNLKNKLFIGFAANQLISSRLNKLNSVPLITTGNKLIRHYNLSASYLAKVNTNISLEPYAMLRTTFITSPQVELGAKMTYNDFVFGGLSYRGKDAVIGLIGLNYKQFMLAYSYDFTTSGIRNYSSGSHEILLAYQFNKKTKTLEIIIEQPKDSDGDGVTDNEDLCPNVKGLLEYKGCPDSDGDGVFDDLDECKTVKGPKENKGCPWPDTDNDGLSDNKDDCPTISGPVENRGCPYGDTDGDGVNDNVDPCPKTAGPIENKGCPVIEKKDQEVIDMAVKNLEFETSKDIIEESSKPSLNTLADKLKQKAEWNLLLSGHTDNVGDDDANMILSKNRAEAVKNYFISKGIAENRIKVNYFGETKPIADNSTTEGRQKNRRVEFVIVFE